MIESINVCDSMACTNNVCVDTDDIWLGSEIQESVRDSSDDYIELLYDWMLSWNGVMRYKDISHMGWHR